MGKKIKIILFCLFVVLLLFTRFYHLDQTARFVWDESSDLVRMHQIFVEKKLTLIGPISEDGNKVFSSLTYYMLLPFAILGRFDPLSTAVGAAFWGTVTALLILFLTKKTNQKFLIPIGILTLIWFPLLETSRWAWNPNLIPFWTILGIIFYLRKTKITRFFSGLSLGLTIHHHYLAIFALAVFIIWVLIDEIKKRKLPLGLLFLLGVFLAISPFVVFDLTHRPGLFLTRIFYFNYLNTSFSFVGLINSLLTNFKLFFGYLTQSTVLAFLFAIAVFFILFSDIKNKNQSLIFAGAWLGQILGLVLTKPAYTHYLLPGLGFFLVWLIWPRKGLGNLLVFISIFLLIFVSLFTTKKQLTQKDWRSDIKSTRFIADFLEEEIKKEQLKNVNLAVLASPDSNTYGRRYRDLLLLKGVQIKDKYEYFTSEHLFVISTSTEKQIRLDPAPEMTNFRSGLLHQTWMIPNSSWQIYLFDKK